jgi:hypothetical protein
MVAGGVPHALEGHAEAVAEMALDRLEEVATLGKKLELPVEIRIDAASASPSIAPRAAVRAPYETSFFSSSERT